MSDNSIYQSPLWEEFKLRTGYAKSFYVGDILVLQKKLPLEYSMLYSPMVSKLQIESIKYKDFLEQIKNIAKETKAIFYRLELDIPVGDPSTLLRMTSHSFVKSFEEMQPENNWILDLTKSEEELLSEMKQKGRYNLKIAERSDIKVTWSDKIGPELTAFYDQYSKTGQRHKISYRGKAYFDALVEIFGTKGYARVYTASKDGVALASSIMLYYNKEALYLYGGSGEEMRNLMAPYILHWQAIKDAKDMGCTKYNFLGIAPTEDANHPWAGITRFKKQLGGYQYDILGCYDLPFKPLLYNLFKMAEKLRR